MGKRACWEVLDCGQGPNSDHPCTVVDNFIADGFLDGEMGSRACFYITGTTCHEDDAEMSIPQKMKTYCMDCKFFQNVIEEEGIQSNIFYYLKFLHEKLEKNGKIHDLPMFQEKLFGDNQ